MDIERNQRVFPGYVNSQSDEISLSKILRDELQTKIQVVFLYLMVILVRIAFRLLTSVRNTSYLEIAIAAFMMLGIMAAYVFYEYR